MSAWHWISRGCARGDVVAACGTCGYGLDGLGAGGNCPECGTPFIAATVHWRGPAAPSEWITFWTVGPLTLLALGAWMLWQWPTGPVATVVGLTLVIVAGQHQSCMNWYINHTLSDIDRRGAGVWTVVAVWTLVSAINGIGGLIVLAIGAIAILS